MLSLDPRLSVSKTKLKLAIHQSWHFAFPFSAAHHLSHPVDYHVIDKTINRKEFQRAEQNSRKKTTNKYICDVHGPYEIMAVLERTVECIGQERSANTDPQHARTHLSPKQRSLDSRTTTKTTTTTTPSNKTN